MCKLKLYTCKQCNNNYMYNLIYFLINNLPRGYFSLDPKITRRSNTRGKKIIEIQITLKNITC